jgi:hypothetical protein
MRRNGATGLGSASERAGRTTGSMNDSPKRAPVGGYGWAATTLDACFEQATPPWEHVLPSSLLRRLAPVLST